MATQTRDTFMYRPETIVHKLVLGYADATADFKFSLAPGAYELAITVYTTAQFAGVSGGAVLGAFKPFLNKEQTIVSDQAYGLYDPNDVVTSAAVPTETLTIARTTTYAKYLLVSTGAGSAASLPSVDHGPIGLPYGFQLSWTNTIATGTAGSLTVEIIAVRMA